MLRRVLVLLSIVGLCMIQFNEDRATASHSTNSYSNMTHWNMAGKLINDGEPVPAAEALVFSIFNQGRQLPAFISVNEICQAQYDYLYQYLSYAGYSRDYYAAAYYPTHARCQWFGNAVFWLGGQHPDGSYSTPFITSHQHPDDLSKPEWRGFVCGKAAFPTFSPCSVHITNKVHQNVNYKNLQIGDIRSWVQFSNACCNPTYLAGDLNVQPSNSAVSLFYSGFGEGDDCGSSNNRATADDDLKKDYIFIPDPSNRIRHDAFIGGSAHSDHHVYVTYYSSAGTACS